MSQPLLGSVAVVPAGRVPCYITGVLRLDTPEEHVRQRVARSLVQEYGYPKSDIAIEFTVQLGRAKKRVDIAVFSPGTVHKQENILLIVETKNPDVKPSDRDNGLEQLHSYMAACPSAQWGLWFGSQMIAVSVSRLNGLAAFNDDEADIPPAGRQRPPRLSFAQLVPAESLKPVFRRVHNYIYANEGMQKDQAFQELLKLIFCKVMDEDNSVNELQFDVDEDERLSALGQRRLRERVERLFESVKQNYSFIFDPTDTIKLSDRVLAYVVSELRRYSLLQTRTDVKGEAYQELVRDNLRGDRGEFFTPDGVCRMAAEMAFAMFPQDRWDSLRVLDPACGTGGFLRASMNVMRSYFERRENERVANEDIARLQAAVYLRNNCERNLFGLDLNPLLVRTTQMNLVMHGDGSSNVYQGNSLKAPGEWSNIPMGDRLLGTMDIVLTNPPFGSGPGLMVDDAHVLEQYELSAIGTERPRSRMAPEHLFIERAANFLKPGGILAIVLPDSILSNPGLQHLRAWMLQTFQVVASIDLPLETFVAFASTGTQTSVLLLRKRTEGERAAIKLSGVMPSHDIFMAVPRTMGYDRRGNDLWLRTADGSIEWVDLIEKLPDDRVRSTPTKVRDDEVAEVASAFSSWIQREMS